MKIDSFFKIAHDKKIENIQITEYKNAGTLIYVLNDTLMDYNIEEILSYDIKALYNNKTVKVSTEYLDKKIVDIIIEKAMLTESIYQDIYLKDTSLNNKITDKYDLSITDKIERLKKLNDIRKEYKNISNLESYFNFNYSKTRIVNDNGVDMSTSSQMYSLYVESSATDGKDNFKFSDSILSTKDDIDIETFSKNVIENSIQMLTKKELETKKYDIILSSKVASKIVGKVVAMTNSYLIRKKTSYLCGMLEKKIFSDKFTLIENPLDKDKAGYHLFDNEGTATYQKEIFKNGVLKTYLYNNKEAILANCKSTASGYENSISVRNCYLTPGDKSYSELIKKMKNGIIITDFMGASGTSIDILNGNISIQIFGFIVENGTIIGSFVPAILTTDFNELFNNIDEIGNDLVFRNTKVASPSLLIKDISIAS